jgi:hypothetical protein
MALLSRAAVEVDVSCGEEGRRIAMWCNGLEVEAHAGNKKAGATQDFWFRLGKALKETAICLIVCSGSVVGYN